jgi:hypothetical protein
MYRRFLIAAAFLWAMIGLGQVSLAQVVTGTYNGAPVMNGSTVMQGAGPTTPVLTYGAPAPTAGISNAGRAGISNSAPLPSTLPSNESTVVYYSQPGVQPQTVLSGSAQGATPATTAPENATPQAAPAENAAPEASAPEPAAKAYFDVGPSADAGSMPTGKSVSLGEVAAQFKSAKAGVSSRTLTNQDVEQMLNSKPRVTVAKNMPPLGPSAMPSGLTQGGAPVANQPQSAPSSSATAAQGGTPAPQPAQTESTSQQTGTPPPSSATESQPAGANAATTPEVSPHQQSNDAQGKSKLPATATFLPLLGLLGVLSGGIGLLVRKLRR